MRFEKCQKCVHRQILRCTSNTVYTCIHTYSKHTYLFRVSGYICIYIYTHIPLSNGFRNNSSLLPKCIHTCKHAYIQQAYIPLLIYIYIYTHTHRYYIHTSFDIYIYIYIYTHTDTIYIPLSSGLGNNSSLLPRRVLKHRSKQMHIQGMLASPRPSDDKPETNGRICIPL